MDHLRIVWQTGEALLEAVPFQEDPEGTRYNVLVALQEMVTNVLRHAYRTGTQGPIVVRFEADANGFRVTLRDRGPEFDPRGHEMHWSEAMPHDAGGFGIMIMRAVMDDVDYARQDGWNVVSMKKLARAPEPAGLRGG
jgi:anti-sigma regulatory factor (Ser/Thr protein kinase)